MSEVTHRTTEADDPRRKLVSVAVLLDRPDVQGLVATYSRSHVVETIRAVLDELRSSLQSGDTAPDASAIVARVQAHLRSAEHERLRPVINATGVLLHTGLGRAVLPQRAVDSLGGLNSCCNLQIDLETGLRGKRNYMTERLLCRLTGAEAGLVVNNNAAATLLILTALCQDKEVIVSRGQLIEIGGAFRLPDCIHQSGAKLVEVGTTNKTHLRDYEHALSENTGAILRVNPSNYRMIGFVQDVPVVDLVTLKSKRPVLVIDDLGCGALIDLEEFGLPHEPTVPESVAAGADLVCFSGDKLIGGPQAGIIVGKRGLVETLKKHPLTRMLRVGKMTDMALEQTLRLFLEPETLRQDNPTLRMLTVSLESLKKRAMRLKRKLGQDAPHLTIRVAEGESASGGGALPGVPIRSFVLAVRAPNISAESLSKLLRRNEPPVIARISRDEVLLDMRTLLEGEDDKVFDALVRIPYGDI